jgi:hypothetical protein
LAVYPIYPRAPKRIDSPDPKDEGDMTRVQRAGHGRFAVLATAFTLACGDGDNEPSGNRGSIQLTLTPATLSLPQGTSGAITVSVARSGGFTGVVTLAVSGLPTGVTTAIEPAQLSAATTTATVTVTPTAAVTPASYTATVTATGEGVTSATATHQLTVTASSGATDVEYQYCDASQAPVFFAYQDGGQEGASAWRRVTGTTSAGVTRFSFTLTQPRGGVLSVFQSASSASASQAYGRPANVAQSLRSHRELRTRLGAAAGKTTAVGRSVLTETYQTYVQYASAAELAQDGLDNCDLTRATKTISATVQSVFVNQYAILALGGSSVLLPGETTDQATFSDVPPGPVDFVGTRLTPGNPPDKTIVLRGLDIPDGGSLPSNVNFDADGVVPAAATATITGGAGEDLEIFTELITANSRLLMWFDMAPSAVAARPWHGLPSANMVTGDLHGLYAFASAPGGDDYRVALKFVGPVADETLSLGGAIPAAGIQQVSTGGYPRFRFSGSLPAEYSKGAEIDIGDGGGTGNTFSILSSRAYLTEVGGTLTYDFTMPDVASLAGFPAAARLTAGPNAATTTLFGFTGSGVFDLKPSLGSGYKAATATASITVP